MEKKISLKKLKGLKKSLKGLKLRRETLSTGKLTAVTGGISTSAECKKPTVPC